MSSQKPENLYLGNIVRQGGVSLNQQQPITVACDGLSIKANVTLEKIGLYEQSVLESPKKRNNDILEDIYIDFTSTVTE